MMLLSFLSQFMQFGIPEKVGGFFSSLKVIKLILHRYAQSPTSEVGLDSFKLTFRINHHRMKTENLI